MNRRRLPSIEKKITSIDPNTDKRVRLLGTIINMSSNIVVVDDGSGLLEIQFDEDISYLRNGQRVRVIGMIEPSLGGFSCKGETVQVLNNLDINLYKRANAIIEGD